MKSILLSRWKSEADCIRLKRSKMLKEFELKRSLTWEEYILLLLKGGCASKNVKSKIKC